MIKSFTENEKRTFVLHSLHMFIEGIIDGALLLSEFILIKSLMGSNYQISYLFQFSVIPLFFSVLLNQFIKRAKNKRKMLRVVAIITRLPLAVIMFFPHSTESIANNSIYSSLFILVFLFYYMYKPVVLPTVNLLLRSNYQTSNFGRLYSYSTSIKKVVVIAATFSFGLLLDFDHYSFTYVFPVLSVLGIISIYLLSFIKFDQEPFTVGVFNVLDSVKLSVKEMLSIIKRNKPFRDFEMGFMLYGLAWMGTTAVITIFMEKQLNLNYSSVAFYKNFFNLIAIILLPVFGRIIDKIDPRKFAIITFGALLLHLLFIPITNFFPIHFVIAGFNIYVFLLVSFLFNGIFTASMALLWGVGSSYFCKNEDAGSYQGIHLTLVGFRGMFAPIIGVLIFESLGYTLTFSFGVMFLLFAILLMKWSQSHHEM